MSVKFSVKGAISTACLLGMLAGSAVSAQDAVDPAIVDQPAVNLPVADAPTEAVTDATVGPDVGVLPDQAAELQPEAFASAAPAAAIAPNEPTGLEQYSDDELQGGLASLAETLSNYQNHFAEIMACVGTAEVCGDATPYHTVVAEITRITDLINEELRRRHPAAVVTPDLVQAPAAAPAAVSAREVAVDATPPAGFCAALAASGDWSDCRWSYRQSQKQ